MSEEKNVKKSYKGEKKNLKDGKFKIIEVDMLKTE